MTSDTNFADELVKFFDYVSDAAECEFWECPLTGDEPHHDCCLTGAASTEG
ncbi:hypothetical protein NPS70_16235 [Streptomyces sp. C10-9-1]|uniref:hypothetical protein n=1 Tax=Streptomyces sp. C10-9-1 TaxID=1859285 RepID=UPI002111A865|nr:hypothetical protein [Streptomyces sp. C10-9-1]MCQ6554735.1 hypothetical protein [Streptomyces sp. C10-9-1]